MTTDAQARRMAEAHQHMPQGVAENYRYWGRGLVAAGWPLIYFTMYAAHHFEASRIIHSPAMGLTALCVTAAAAIGYLYPAVRFERLLVDSIILILFIVVLRALLMRSIFLAQRRLAQQQAAAARAVQDDAAEATSAEAAGAATGRSVPECEEVDVAALSANARALLGNAVAFAIIIGLAVE